MAWGPFFNYLLGTRNHAVTSRCHTLTYIPAVLPKISELNGCASILPPRDPEIICPMTELLLSPMSSLWE